MGIVDAIKKFDKDSDAWLADMKNKPCLGKQAGEWNQLLMASPGIVPLIIVAIQWDQCPVVDNCNIMVIVVSAANIIGAFVRFLTGGFAKGLPKEQKRRADMWSLAALVVLMGTAIWGCALVFPNLQYLSNQGNASGLVNEDGESIDDCTRGFFIMAFLTALLPLAIPIAIILLMVVGHLLGYDVTGEKDNKEPAEVVRGELDLGSGMA